jgi:hypothetical protein
LPVVTDLTPTALGTHITGGEAHFNCRNRVDKRSDTDTICIFESGKIELSNLHIDINKSTRLLTEQDNIMLCILTSAHRQVSER